MGSDTRLSFNEAAEVYSRARPSYPTALFDELFRWLPREPHIVEVGPGTGQATRDLLARGASVHAIEIGPAMARVLRESLSSDQLRVTIADFETVEIEEHSADCLFSATAYHWISSAAQTDRPATILYPGGVIAIVDLIQVASPDDGGFFEACQPIYERHGRGDTGIAFPSREAVDPAIRSVLDGDQRFGEVTVSPYDWNQSYLASEYRQLMLSYSDVQTMNEHDRLGLLNDIEALIHSDFGGTVTRPLVVTLTTATPR